MPTPAQQAAQPAAFNNLTELVAATARKLKASGLSVGDGQRLKMTPLMAANVAMLGLPVALAGFKIPYFTLAGQPTKFFRFRYLEQPIATNGFAALTAVNRKPLRYAQPANTLNELYLPPLTDWQRVAADTDTPVVITEGELKAACGTKHGAPTIGLGGVWCWRSAAEGLPLLPGFGDINWQDRQVFICFDSDAQSNLNVQQAENFLARALLTLGALPYVCRLPAPAKDGAKCGLDDYVVEHGWDKFQTDIIGKAQAWQAAKELFQLNEEVVYVTDPGLILRYSNLQRMSPQNFVNHAYSNRTYWENTVQGKDTKMVEKSAPKEWLKWSSRATVKKLTYQPGAPRTTSKGEFNLWPGWGATPRKGDVTPWRNLLDYLFKDAPRDARRWFEQWLAYPLQHPGTKLYSAALMWGVNHGTGKSLVGYSMFQIYGRNATEIGDRDLISTHNEWAENRQFVMGDEITGGDKRSMSDRMKSIITQLWLRINAKYVPAYTIPDCINYFFTSNHPDSLFLEDTDRRYFIHEVTGRPLAPEFYREYAAWLGIGADPDQPRGADYLFNYLLNLDLTGFNPQGHAPATASKANMIDAGRSDVGSWVAQLREDPDGTLQVAGKALPYKLWTTKELFTIFDPNEKGRVTLNGLSRELSRAGFHKVHLGQPVRTAAGLAKLWAIRDVDTLLAMRANKVAELYDRERGIASGKAKTKF